MCETISKENRQVNMKFFYLSILLTLSISVTAQKEASFIEDSLKQELIRKTFTLESTEKKAERLMYLITAKEMAIRSTELKDSIFQGLVAIQAFNFNTNYEGNKNDIDIYRGLYQALQRFEDPIIKVLPKIPNQTDDELIKIEVDMREKLCFQIKRNMTVYEWEKFSPSLKYEKTCGQ